MRPVRWVPACLLSLLFLSFPGSRLLHAGQDPQLNEMAQSIESDYRVDIYKKIFCSDWTKTVLKGLSMQERGRLAKLLRKAKKPEIREGRLEQYRVLWRSKTLPDSEFVATFHIDTRPGDDSQPMIAFSSRVEQIPTLLADALDHNDMRLAVSLHKPLSSWADTLPTLEPADRAKRAAFYRSLQLVESREDERVYTGRYVAPNGLLVQDELRIRLQPDGRWEAE